MKDNIDTTDLEDARAQLHTFDSYARALANQVLAGAQKQIKEGKQTHGSNGEVMVDMKFTLVRTLGSGTFHVPWRVCHYEYGPDGKPHLVCVNLPPPPRKEA